MFAKPIPLPKPKPRWGLWIAWTLLVFAGGVAAGPTLTDQAALLVEKANEILGLSPPQPVATGSPVAPAAPRIVTPPAPAPTAAPTEVDTTTATDTAAPAPSPGMASERPPSVAPAAPEVPAKGSTRDRGGARTSRRKPVAARTSAPAGANDNDPFAAAATPVKGSKAKPSQKTSDAPTRTATATSTDPLVNLMAGMAEEKKPRDNKGKNLDALLKEVQQSDPEPAPKKEAPPPPSSLTQDDISRAMAGVKTRSRDCASQFGQSGIAELRLAVSKDGRVTNASVRGKMAGTPVGACVAAAARQASFPPSAGLRFDYRLEVRP